LKNNINIVINMLC